MRAFLRLIAVVAITTPVYLGIVACKPLTWISRRRGLAVENAWLLAWGRALAFVIGVRVKSEGSPPRAPFFLVSNHLSYLDIVVYASLIEGRFLAKSELAGWPLFGFMARTSGTLFIERTRPRDLERVLPAVASRLGSGGGVVVFPEGTSTKGAEVRPFKPSLFEVAIQTGTPVTCAAITYATPAGSPPAHQAVCWWGDAPFLGHFFRLLALPRIDATVAFGAAPITASDRKSLAERARRAVEDRFTPVVGCVA